MWLERLKKINTNTHTQTKKFWKTEINAISNGNGIGGQVEIIQFSN